MTKSLFYENPYLRSFTAAVTECIPADGCWKVKLDATAFYAEGGGQPADTGTLGSVHVLDTREKDGQILHTTDGPLEPGVSVEGTIDWQARFSRMQHHTGEHIVSGLINRLYGFHNVGFHMGRDAVTLDLSGELSAGDLAKVETLANEAVWKNLPVNTSYPPPEELSALNYRSKKDLSGDVRIVTVPDYDVCACCGLHVARTGEIGLIKLVNAQRYKGGTRIWMLCGDRALADYADKNNAVFSLSALLSAKPGETVSAVQRLLAERDTQKAEYAALQERLFHLKAAQAEPCPLTVQFEDALSPNGLRLYCLALCQRCTVAAVLSGDGKDWKYALGSASEDVRPLGKALNNAFSGRGGGKKELVQGSLRGTKDEIEAFFHNSQ